MSEGRNTLYLTQHGWQVTGADIAEKALAFAQQRAHQLGVTFTIEFYEMATCDWGTSKWDLIVLNYAGGRDYAAHMAQALKPGGLVVLAAFHLEATARLPVTDGDYRVFFNTNELPKLYRAAGVKIMRYEELLAPPTFQKKRCASWPKNLSSKVAFQKRAE